MEPPHLILDFFFEILEFLPINSEKYHFPGLEVFHIKAITNLNQRTTNVRDIFPEKLSILWKGNANVGR